MTETKTKLIAKIVQTAGHGIHKRILFESNVVPFQFQREDILKAQEEAGYHPCGYGCSDVAIVKIEEGWKATWTCSGSCD